MAEVTFVNSEHCCRSRATNPHQVTKSPSPVPHHHTPPSCTHPPPPAPDVRSLLSVTGHKPAPSHQVQFRITTHLLPFAFLRISENAFASEKTRHESLDHPLISLSVSITMQTVIGMATRFASLVLPILWVNNGAADEFRA